MSQSFSHNVNSLNTNYTVNFTVADDRSDILAWLSPLDPRSRHQDIQDRRVESVGEWLLQTEEFRNWQAGSGEDESDNAVLFCYGNPGVGKTYISSLVIDSLCDQAGEQNSTVACFYFDFTVQKEQSPASMMGALLKQVVGGLEEIPEEVSQTYQKQKKGLGGRGPRLSDIVKMLQITSSKARTFICIDAIDECLPEYRVKLLDSLNKILQNSPGIWVFVTGRPHIRLEIEKRLGRVTSLSINAERDDMIRYLESRLEEDTTPDAMDSSLKAEILRKIPENISEIFLLASLSIDAILQETTIHRRRQKLSAMTDGLGLEDAYGATLVRIKGQGGERARLGLAALMWISYSERPLKANELCHALAVEIGSPNLNVHNAPSMGTILACCQGLVVVEKETSTVRLIHFTVQEYLRAHPDLFGASHSTMAETCLSYLNSHQVKAFPIFPFPDPRDTPFLRYSSLYWGVHAKRHISDSAKQLALKLFDDYDRHISAEILLGAQRMSWYNRNTNEPSMFGGLHCASFFGIVEIVACLVEMAGCDINKMDFWGITPLSWAARNGHEGVVKILLGRDDVNPDKPDINGRTPLWLAAWNGHEGVVKILLGRDSVDPDKSDNYGQKPLSWAARNGNEGVVNILLGRDDVNPDNADNDGQTPLWRAARNGHEGVVKILLGRDDVNPDKSDNNGRSPLFTAACFGHEGVAKMLLARGVKPDKPNINGRTPLHLAAWNGQEGVVKILLGRDDVNPHTLDNDGKTPLDRATERGRQGVIAIFQPPESVVSSLP